MKFTKMHGCGNDYVYVNCFTEQIADAVSAAKQVSDRHFGIGADGLILIKPSDKADFTMEMYNADGSRSKMCGNGIRCVAKYVFDYGLTQKKNITVESGGSIKYLDLKVEDGKVAEVTVNMGSPITDPKLVPVNSNKKEIIVDEGARTNVKGIYGAGDVTTIREKLVINAAAHGVCASFSI
jgi:diaminopimelate epimerase